MSTTENFSPRTSTTGNVGSNVGSTHPTENVSSAHGTDNIGSTHGTDNIGSTHGTDNVGSTHGLANVGSTHGSDNIRSTHGSDNIRSTHAPDNVGSTHAADNVRSTHGTNNVGHGIDSVGSTHGTDNIRSTHGTDNVGSTQASSAGIGSGAVPTHHHTQERNGTLESGHTAHTEDSTRAEVGHDEHSEYPEQKHAGKTGYGPNFKLGPTLGDKMDGAKDILKGKVKRNPELVQHGRDEIAGTLQQRERERDMNEDPFKHGNDGAGSDVQKQAATADITGSS